MDRRDFVHLAALATGVSLGGTGLDKSSGAIGRIMAEGSVSTVSDLQSVDPRDNGFQMVLGYHEAYDGGGGLFVWEPDLAPSDVYGSSDRANGALWVSSSAQEDGFWCRILTGEAMNVRWFGARGDGRSDDAAAINDAIWMAGYLDIARVFIPEGTYAVSEPIRLTWASGLTVEGASKVRTRIQKTEYATVPVGHGVERRRVDACVVLDTIEREENIHGTDHYATTIKNLKIEGTPERRTTYGLYVTSGNRIRIQDIYAQHCDTAFRAERLWMSELKNLSGKSVHRFVHVGGEVEEEGRSSTSLTIQNCYVADDVSGTAFLLTDLYYASLDQCGADNVGEWPYHIARSQGVSLRGCGFEHSLSGKGIWMHGSRGHIESCKGINVRPCRDEEEPSAPLRVSDWDRQQSRVVVTSSHFGSLVDSSNTLLRDDVVDAALNRKLVLTGGSHLTVVDSYFPSNAHDHPGWDEDSSCRLLRIGGDGIRVQTSGRLSDEDTGIALDDTSMRLGGRHVATLYGSDVSQLDQQVSDEYTPREVQAISDRLDALIAALHGTHADDSELTGS